MSDRTRDTAAALWGAFIVAILVFFAAAAGALAYIVGRYIQQAYGLSVVILAGAAMLIVIAVSFYRSCKP